MLTSSPIRTITVGFGFSPNQPPEEGHGLGRQAPLPSVGDFTLPRRCTECTRNDHIWFSNGIMEFMLTPDHPSEQAYGQPGDEREHRRYVMGSHQLPEHPIGFPSPQNSDASGWSAANASPATIQPIMNERSSDGQMERCHQPPEDSGNGRHVEPETRRHLKFKDTNDGAVRVYKDPLARARIQCDDR